MEPTFNIFNTVNDTLVWKKCILPPPDLNSIPIRFPFLVLHSSRQNRRRLDKQTGQSRGHVQVIFGRTVYWWTSYNIRGRPLFYLRCTKVGKNPEKVPLHRQSSQTCEQVLVGKQDTRFLWVYTDDRRRQSRFSSNLSLINPSTIFSTSWTIHRIWGKLLFIDKNFGEETWRGYHTAGTLRMYGYILTVKKDTTSIWVYMKQGRPKSLSFKSCVRQLTLDILTPTSYMSVWEKVLSNYLDLNGDRTRSPLLSSSRPGEESDSRFDINRRRNWRTSFKQSSVRPYIGGLLTQYLRKVRLSSPTYKIRGRDVTRTPYFGVFMSSRVSFGGVKITPDLSEPTN